MSGRGLPASPAVHLCVWSGCRRRCWNSRLATGRGGSQVGEPHLDEEQPYAIDFVASSSVSSAVALYWVLVPPVLPQMSNLAVPIEGAFP